MEDFKEDPVEDPDNLEFWQDVLDDNSLVSGADIDKDEFIMELSNMDLGKKLSRR